MTNPAPMGKRPTVELVVLVFTVTVCLVLVILAVGIAVAGAVQPNSPLLGTYYLAGLSSAVSVILGALLGLLAGRLSARRQRE